MATFLNATRARWAQMVESAVAFLYLRILLGSAFWGGSERVSVKLNFSEPGDETWRFKRGGHDGWVGQRQNSWYHFWYLGKTHIHIIIAALKISVKIRVTPPTTSSIKIVQPSPKHQDFQKETPERASGVFFLRPLTSRGQEGDGRHMESMSMRMTCVASMRINRATARGSKFCSRTCLAFGARGVAS